MIRVTANESGQPIDENGELINASHTLFTGVDVIIFVDEPEMNDYFASLPVGEGEE
jgi:hypothetical protein